MELTHNKKYTNFFKKTLIMVGYDVNVTITSDTNICLNNDMKYFHTVNTEMVFIYILLRLS